MSNGAIIEGLFTDRHVEYCTVLNNGPFPTVYIFYLQSVTL